MAGPLKCRSEVARGERPARRRDGADECVPPEYIRPCSFTDGAAQRRLLNGKKRPDLLTARAQHADGGSRQQQPELCGRHKHQACRGHQHGADNQHAAASEAVGVRRDRKRHRRVAKESQCEQHAGLCGRQAHLDEVEHEHDRQRPVGKQTDEARREEKPPVSP